MQAAELVEIQQCIEAKISAAEAAVATYRELNRPVAPDNAIGRISRMDASNNKGVTEAALRFHNSLGREFCTVRYDKIRHVVVVVWRGLVTQESRAQVWQQLLQVLRITGCPSLLNNWQEFLGAPSAEQQWLQQVWDEVATQAGLRFLADVLKVNSLSQDYLRPCIRPTSPG